MLEDQRLDFDIFLLRGKSDVGIFVFFFVPASTAAFADVRRTLVKEEEEEEEDNQPPLSHLDLILSLSFLGSLAWKRSFCQHGGIVKDAHTKCSK